VEPDPGRRPRSAAEARRRGRAGRPLRRLFPGRRHRPRLRIGGQDHSGRGRSPLPARARARRGRAGAPADRLPLPAWPTLVSRDPGSSGSARGAIVDPELLLCDGHGFAPSAPARPCLPSGLVARRASIAVAKSRLIRAEAKPGADRGAWSPWLDLGQTIGAVLRAGAGAKPLSVSIGTGRAGERAPIDSGLRGSSPAAGAEPSRPSARLWRIPPTAARALLRRAAFPPDDPR
jgi:deoxyribonuclease V